MNSQRQITFKVPNVVAKRLDAEAPKCGEKSGSTYARTLLLNALGNSSQPTRQQSSHGQLQPLFDEISKRLAESLVTIDRRMGEIKNEVAKLSAPPCHASTKQNGDPNHWKVLGDAFQNMTRTLEDLKAVVVGAPRIHVGGERTGNTSAVPHELERKVEKLREDIRRAAAYILIKAQGANPKDAHAWANKHFAS
jgi:hypothetical protein